MTYYISAKTIPQAVIIFYNIHVDRNRRFTTMITRREERNSSFTNDPPPFIMYIDKSFPYHQLTIINRSTRDNRDYTCTANVGRLT